MKTIKKLLTSILVLAALALTACTNLIDTEEKATTNTSAYLKINGGNAARTVTPDYELDKMTDFMLIGAKDGKYYTEQLATFESYAELQNATIPIAPGIWHSLTLTAYEEQTVLTATISDVTIQSGINTLTFALEPDTTATTTGMGNICVTFTIPSATAVQRVKAGLFDRSVGDEISDYELEALALNTTETDTSAVFEQYYIKCGTYRLKAWFYADEACTAIVSTYNELVTVIAGNTSQAERNVQLNDTFTITEVLNGGSYAADYTPATVYTRYSNLITLPTMDEIKKDGYFFDGWYTTDDYTGEQITEIPAAQAENVTVYAKWVANCIEVYASKLSSTDLAKDSFGDTYTIQLCGEWTYEKLRTLGSKIKDISDWKRITLDMTQATGITSLYDTSYWEDGTFYGCHTLTSVLLPDTLKTINNYAFNQCYNLESITIPDSVKSIGYEAFNGCSALTSVTIPDSVESIGYDAFFGCYNLESATIPSSVTSISNNPFRYCSRLTSLTVSEGNTAYKSSQNCIYTKNGKELIAAAGGLTNVTIDNSVTSIGNYAFSGCSNLESVIIPNSVISIDYGAFENCSSLTSVTIGNSVTYIGGDAFRDCYKLENIIIPDNVENIDYGAFYNCTSLESVTIGSGVISIGGYAFRDCRKLISVIIPDSVESIGYDAFENCTSLTNVTIGNGVTYIGSSAFSRCSSLENITIGNSVTNIDQMAFYGCRELTSVTIPGSVTDINSHAFWNCTALATINFAGTMEQWENVTKGDGWNSEVPATKVVCSDGEVTL